VLPGQPFPVVPPLPVERRESDRFIAELRKGGFKQNESFGLLE
jgi:hypothetical protein